MDLMYMDAESLDSSNVDCMLKVTNISAFVSESIIHQIFEFIGEIKNLKIYSNPGLDGSQECIIEYINSDDATLALYLSGTQLYDRVFHVRRRTKEEIEQQKKILEISKLFNTPPNLNPILQPNMTPEKAEKIARTVYVGNLNTSITEKELIDFFSVCGPIAYAKMAGDVSHPSRFAFLEFATIQAAQFAMKMSGTFFRDKIIKVNHSNNVINLGVKKNESKEIMLALKGVKEAEMLINKKYGSEDQIMAPGAEAVSDVSMTPKVASMPVNPNAINISGAAAAAAAANSVSSSVVERNGPSIYATIENDGYHHSSRSRTRSRDRDRSHRRRSRSRSDYYRYLDEGGSRSSSRHHDRSSRDRDRERERRHRERERYEREMEMMRERDRDRERRHRSHSRSESRRKHRDRDREREREKDYYRK